MQKIKLVLYYILIAKLPHSRLLKFFNCLRVYYVCRVLKIMAPGTNAYFEPNIYIGSGKDIQIGVGCQINEDVFIQGATIGDHVMIAPNVAILSRTHHFEDVTVPMIQQGASEILPPEICNDVWIGRNAVIMPGVRVGEGSIVGAGAVVVKDIEPYSIVGGVPAKLIRKRV